jgi:hypothetical protein
MHSIAAPLVFSASAWSSWIPTHEKSAYNLFNPTPRELMREMYTDRPDVTESPHTVDAGHFQLEMSVIDYARAGDDETLTIAPFNLKAGLTNSIDLQFVFDPYIIEDIENESGGDNTNSGAGDAQLRLKLNLWGNDEGATAVALMPFIKFPTAADDLSNDEFEGGLIVPFSVELPDEWSLGLMAEFDAVYDDEDDDYDMEGVHTVAVGHEIAGPLAGFVEYVGVAATDSGSPYRAQLGGGLTYDLSEDLRLDTGIHFGLTDEADDVNVFAGLAVRF